ncbi:MAG: hypothetical protein LBI05_07325, partial [Planctomycetaceae bacterium]|nr:hypothetical protein [Planctomycetaceae bacterium]
MLQQQLLDDLASATTAEQVENVRIKYLGRKGLITNLAKETDFSKLSAEEKKDFGQKLNELKNFAAEKLQEAADRVSATAAPTSHRLLDLTVPGANSALGAMHPISMVQMELESIFEGMGFTVLDSPEAETEYSNFESVNIPADHPARDMQDTFWLTN